MSANKDTEADDTTVRTHERPVWQLVSLLAGFAVLVIIGVMTVVVPELQDDPDDATAEAPAQGAADDERDSTE